MRIDRLLFFLRFARSRAVAQRWIAEGHIRHNGQRVVRQDLAVQPGDVLTLPLAKAVLVIEMLHLPTRRGPAEEARECYRPLDGGRPMDLGGGDARNDYGARQEEGNDKQ
ncbi:S4 domain-containing protein [Altererythrobacter sp. Root672]|uniref:S4 domain-containing protein n=1 Tax=Altererythrobacter sp. Root672 TaxID=1736584 RepID=UPI0009EA4290|nr:S4 domain-containing protein [Altererythrobacter sp. Root672]